MRRNLQTALAEVTTEYTLVLEHDWRFVADVDVRALVAVMDDHQQIQSVRFGKRPNQVDGWTTVVEPDSTRSIPLCRVSSFTNQPYLCRTGTLTRWVASATPSLQDWLLMRQRAPYVERLDGSMAAAIATDWIDRTEPHVFKRDDVEFVLDSRYKALIRDQGFRRAHEQVGLYAYGGYRDGPYVEHLGRSA